MAPKDQFSTNKNVSSEKYRKFLIIWRVIYYVEIVSGRVRIFSHWCPPYVTRGWACDIFYTISTPFCFSREEEEEAFRNSAQVGRWARRGTERNFQIYYYNNEKAAQTQRNRGTCKKVPNCVQTSQRTTHDRISYKK